MDNQNKKNRFETLTTFTSDMDGLSMIDVITIIIIICTIIWKIVHVICIIRLAESSPQTMTQLNTFANGIDSYFNIIISFYFVKKGVDTTVTKVVLKDKYQEMYNGVMDVSPQKHEDINKDEDNNK